MFIFDAMLFIQISFKFELNKRMLQLNIPSKWIISMLWNQFYIPEAKFLIEEPMVYKVREEVHLC